MSAGFFGSYFRRKHREEGSIEPVSPAKTTPRGETGEVPPAASQTPAPEQEDRRTPPPAAQDAPPSEDPQGEQASYRLSQVVDLVHQEAEEQAPVAAEEAVSAPSPEASPLDELTQDKVTVALLQEGVVAMPQALIALRQQKEEQPEAALWRVLASLSGVDREKIFAVAAQVQGFELARLSEGTPSDELVKAVCALFPAEVSAEMFALGLFPFAFMMDSSSENHSMVLATHDPSHPDVAAFVHKLNLRVELRYARETIVAGRIRRLLGSDVEEAAASSTPLPPEEEHDPTSPTEPQAPLQPRNNVTAEDLVNLIQGDVAVDEEVIVENKIDPARPNLQGGDGYDNDLPPEHVHAAQQNGQEGDDAEDPAGGPDENVGAQHAAPPAAPPASSDGPPEAEAPEVQEEPGEGPAPEEVRSKDRVVTMLLRKGVVTSKQVHDAQERQRTEASKDALWRILAQLPNVDREVVFAEAASVYAFPVARLGQGKPDPEFARSVVETFSEKHREDLFKLRVLPFECDLESKTGAIKLVFVTHDPTRPEVHRLMQKLKLERFELRYAPESVVMAAMAEAFPRKNEFLERISEGSMAMDIGASFEDKSQLIDEDALEAEIGRSALINLFEATLVEAVRQGASDIHIYPNAKKKIEIHFRVDGRLNHWHTEDKVHPEAFLAVIKDNSTNVDRFERDAAQDGFIQRWIDEALIRFRVSVLPIANASQELHSESIVIRVLDDRKVLTDLKKLGLLDRALERFNHAIRQPHGMVILTGPTGSGKSTTLVAALHQVVTPEVNVLTVEDPVEYIIPGVRQIKLNHKLGLEEALRSILRHDPDVVMVGEMRDRQTAELAIKLANTGHLTFSTLHTNDAPAAVSRLYKMGIEPFLIAYAINLVVAQRLIRTLCPECKQAEDDPDPVMMKRLGFTPEEINTLTIYRQGNNAKCPSCKGTGYKGRRAICEAMYFSRQIRHLIVEADKMIDEGALRDQAVKEGMLTLADSAREIVKMGETSLLEMIRVVTSES